MSSSYILEIGLATPQYRLTQDEAATLMGQRLGYDKKATKYLQRVYKKTAIEYRHTILNPREEFLPVPLGSTADRMKIYEKNATPLALTAITNGISPQYLSKISHLITVSCTGMYAPGLDIELLLQLNLPTHIERTCINFMGCYGAFNALKVADAICQKDSHAFVLIVCVEFCSLHFQPINNHDNLIANAIFADGAACVLVHSQPLNQKNLHLKGFRCELAGYEKQAMAWGIGDKGFDIILSSYVPQILRENIADLITPLLKYFQLNLQGIDFFAIHPGGKEILSAIESSLTIPAEKNGDAHQILRNYGNMSSPTILFVLKSILDRLDHSHHKKMILAMAFGPGLTIESGLLEFIHV